MWVNGHKFTTAKVALHRRGGWLLLCALLNGEPLPAAEPAGPTAAELKAAVVCQLTKFVEWPEPPSTNAPLVIGVVGESPLITALERLLQSAQNSFSGSLTIQKLVPSLSRSNAASCHLVVLGERLPERSMTSIIETLRGQGILTISDAQGFTRHGGMVGLGMEDQRVQIEVNLAACERARIRFSSRLLRQVKIVSPPAPKSP
ncbi:YfiR family protein [Fontisphaera persica]|uniref:YfiR family protein n=1 Tax=Fontisphaera persica TaxID=2974023 RepID=UPI0024C09C93|nr:YfiR family protein [Fontisphaera persica]WCJ58604.1 YfiR family protein [Fontisphaera persica]